MSEMLRCVFLLFCAGSTLGVELLQLNGIWNVTTQRLGRNIIGTVPGSMYTALMADHQIGDPYFRKNDEEYKYIADEDWTYSRTFTVSDDVMSSDVVELVCEGLDTIATVSINNKTVGTSDNMFVRYVYDIKPMLRNGTNTVTVAFQSATQYVNKLAQNQSYPVLPMCVPPEFHGACGANLIRKMQCSFSWDWGPSYPTQGIWRDIYIQGYTAAVLREVTTETSKNTDGSWTLTVVVFTNVRQGSIATGTMQVKLNGTQVTQTKQVSMTSKTSNVLFEINIPKSENIQSWWPNGYGNQSLYDLHVFYTDAGGNQNTRHVRIGFRTVELVQDYVSVNKSLGRTFYFRINGQPVFLKGSNWIPADSFPERVTLDRLRNYLTSARDVHMNAMRVWGGGVYESSDFYSLCDELGIMIWQDFMFACAMYPTDHAFLISVAKEVFHQVRRLKHHPSIIVLSGNNENEKALVQDWYGTDVDPERYRDDYRKLYLDTVRLIVQQEDTSRPFLISSPSNGVETEAEGGIARQPWDTHYGDIHDYQYLAAFFNPAIYRVPRMASEYGLQSFPSLETLEPVYNTSDMDYWSDLNDYRNHHPFGNIQMMAEAIQYVKLPNNPDRRKRFDDLIYVTQITHAIGMRTETEHYRRWQNRLDDQGQGHTMGALYWMLADIWQAPTWASIEYGGKWKMLHYFAKQFFAPTLISPYIDGNDLDVYIVMDELPVKEVRHSQDHALHFKPTSNPRPFYKYDVTSSIIGKKSVSTNMITYSVEEPADDFSGNLYIQMFSWDQMAPLLTWRVAFTINSTAQSVFRNNIDTMVTESGCTRRQTCFLHFHFGDDVTGPSNWLSLSQFTDAQGLQKANVLVTDIAATSVSNEFNITIATDAIAPFVWLEAYGLKGRFSDNGFLLTKQTKTVTFIAWETATRDKLKTALRIKSLMDVYQ